MVGIKHRLALIVMAGVLVASTVGAVATAGPASAAVTSQTGPAGALAIAQAIATPSAHLTGASFESTTGGTPNGTSDSALGEFPTDNTTFGILTTGNVDSVPQPGTFANTGNGGLNVRGNSDLDVTVLKADVNVPTGSNCLAFDFKFLSEEYPQFVGSAYNDAFIAEVDSSTWTTTGSAISAPNNFAFDGAGDVVSINSTGIGGLTAADGTGTAFDSSSDPRGAATGLLHAAHQITPGAHSVYFSIFDQGDDSLDSAAFLDNLVVGFVPNPAVNCAPGANPVNYTLDLMPASASSDIGTQHTVTATLTDSAGEPIGNAPIGFTVAGANPETDTVTTGEGGQAEFTYTGNNAGTDQIAACYDADNEPPCEVTASATKVWTNPVGLSVDSALDPNPVTAGNNVLDTATVTATGTGIAHNVSATVSAAAGGTALSATVSQGTCAPPSGTNVTCTIGDLAAGSSATIKALFKAPAPVPVGGTFSVTTAAQSNEVDPVSDIATATVQPKSNTSTDGYVPPQGTLKVGPNAPTTGINTVAAFTLPNAGPGTSISLDTLASPPAFCGGTSCRGKIVQLSTFEGYHDPAKPPALVLRFDKSVVVNGLVATIYGQKAPDGPIFVIPQCAPRPEWSPLYKAISAILVFYGLGPHSFYASPSPCVNAKWLSADGDLNVTVLALSGDPKIGVR